MSYERWTPAQRLAIEDEGGALLVSAAAGSGKTSVLVERVLSRLAREKDPIAADRLLILTFTNAAAEELRARLAGGLEERLRSLPGNMALQRQRMLLKRAFIGTVDAFCGQLVREHFAVLGLPADITVGDETLMLQLSQNALAETMEAMYDDADFSRFCGLYGRARNDSFAEQTVKALYDHTRTVPIPDALLQRYVQMYSENLPLGKTVWGQTLLAAAKETLQEAKDLVQRALRLALQDAGFEKQIDTLKEDLDCVCSLQQAVNTVGWNEIVRQVRLAKLVTVFRKKAGVDEDLLGQMRSAHKAAKEILTELQKEIFVCSEEEAADDLAAAAPMVRALVEAVRMYGEKFALAKQEEHVLDFNDVEHLALALLRDENDNRSALCEEVAARYDMVMVDEYQDTNELQDTLYTCFAKEDGSNLFYVGDVKQSIYRFRYAQPELFLAKRDIWAPHASGQHPAQISLGHNFRSTAQVIEGANFVFRRLMSRRLGEVDYTEEEELIAGASYQVLGAFAADVVEGGRAEEAAHVAQTIARMVEERQPVEENGCLRPCGYGDFCILLRSRSHMREFSAALEQLGIPVAADTVGDLMQAPEVLPLSAVLCAIDNPGDDVMLTAAMMGPFFGFTAQQLADIRAACPRGPLWEALAASKREDVQTFCEAMRRYRMLAGKMSVGRLCEVLLDESGYLAAVAAMEAGNARRENVLAFIGWAAEIDSRGRGGLAGFVRVLASGGGPPAPTTKIVPGHVNLMTVHKSKGLEFPFVFLCSAGQSFNTRDLSAHVQMHPKLGLGMALRMGNTLFDTLPLTAIAYTARQESLSEEMRLLYVALTRAKQQLRVTLAHKDTQKLLEMRALDVQLGLTPYRLSRMAYYGFGGWLLCAMLSHPLCAHIVNKLQVSYKAVVQVGEPAFALTVYRAQVSAEEALQPEDAYRLTAPADPALTRALLAAFSRVPAQQPLAQVPAKVSVSALAKGQDLSLLRRPSLMYKQGLSAAERGTAQHSFLQYCCLDILPEEIPGELQRLVREGFLSEAMAQAVNLEGTRAFWASAVMQRVRKAQRVLREYDFITAVPAAQVKKDLPEHLAHAEVLVQGIADLVLVFEDHVEIVDHKTDRGVDATTLVERYRTQLQLYKNALEKALELPVRRLTIWSFALAQEVDVPLE